MNSEQRKLPKPVAYALGLVLSGLALLPVFYLLPIVEEKLFNFNCAQVVAENDFRFDEIKIERGRGGQIQAIRCRAQPPPEAKNVAAQSFDLYSDWLWAINIFRLALFVLSFYICKVFFDKIGISARF